MLEFALDIRAYSVLLNISTIEFNAKLSEYNSAMIHPFSVTRVIVTDQGFRAPGFIWRLRLPLFRANLLNRTNLSC